MKKTSNFINKRIELAKIFYPLDQTAKRRWARVFRSNWKNINDKFENLAGEWEFSSKSLSDNTILWIDSNNNSIECMFCFIEDISKLELISDIFEKIKNHQPFFTYAIVHQKKDGEGTYDIFRFSRFSYLEHCNRVRI